MPRFSPDDKVQKLMSDLFNAASEGNFKSQEQWVESALDDMFKTHVWGFREIVLVVVIARLTNPTYMASTGLYDCSPRSLYEGPIDAELRARHIPHRKSGPLNIAKATVGLTTEWAAQRVPVNVANHVVKLVKYIEGINKAELWNFAVFLHNRFLKEAIKVAKLTVILQAESDPSILHQLSWGLITNAPDAGNTAQRITGLALLSAHEYLRTGIKVEGHEDRASTTSTTSKKPGDINEVRVDDGKIMAVYEVTTKAFGAQRIRESYEAVRAFGEANDTFITEVLVLCRPEDIPAEVVRKHSALVSLGYHIYEDLTYEFINMSEWLMLHLVLMPPAARIAFHGSLSEYVNDYKTSEKVKLSWASLNEAVQSSKVGN
jgi:hypothetical protein